ncbi:unnamed protein product, partial [Lampetra fluviatilis]
FRPMNKMGDKVFMNGQTANLQAVIKAACTITRILSLTASKPHLTATLTGEEVTVVDAAADDDDGADRAFLAAIPGPDLASKLHTAWGRLQLLVNVSFDSELDRTLTDKHPGVKQLLEKKEGLFRKHMMGKRVDFAARSVICPDMFIGTHEIGVPMKLTYPERVTPWNVASLRRCVLNGPALHPGAVAVVSEDGARTELSASDATQRRAVAQRLLTRWGGGGGGGGANSAMMNNSSKLEKWHGPEAMGLAATHTQYLVPKDGTPLAGLIQDHVVAAAAMTLRGAYFTREQYHRLSYLGLHGQAQRLQLLPPAIRKPHILWTGKQLVSTLLLNSLPRGSLPLNLTGSAKVIIRGGELLCGLLDKAHMGSTSLGLVHSVHELYGGDASGRLLTNLARLFTAYLQLYRGFSLGVEDILVKEAADAQRLQIIHKSHGCGDAAVRSALSLSGNVSRETLSQMLQAAHLSGDPRDLAAIDVAYKRQTDNYSNDINKVCMPSGLCRQFPDNGLQLMVQSGAKGSTVNTMQ